MLMVSVIVVPLPLRVGNSNVEFVVLEFGHGLELECYREWRMKIARF